MYVLNGQVVLVTGAAGTLGRAIATAIEGQGGAVFRTDVRGVVGRDLDQLHDVASEQDWEKVVVMIGDRFGRLDGLVNNAGVLHVGSIEDTSFEDWRRVMAVNADSVFLGCRAAWPLLRRSETASIVNVSSVSGLVGGANLAAYNASKGAVRLLTKSTALHGARLTPPIRCNSLHPSFVEGNMADAVLAASRDPERARAKIVSEIPLRRLAQPDEISRAVLYLLSTASGFMTGSEFVIDGGLTAR